MNLSTLSREELAEFLKNNISAEIIDKLKSESVVYCNVFVWLFNLLTHLSET
jgi:hypothetical protein